MMSTIEHAGVCFAGVVRVSSEEEYRCLAIEARAKALAATDPYDKRTFLLVAQRYDVLAERARRMAQTAKKLKSA